MQYYQPPSPRPSGSFTIDVHGRAPRQDRMAQKIHRRNIVSLIIGGLILFGVFLPYILFGSHNLAVLYMAYYRVYIPLQIISTIACVIILILNLSNSITYRLKSFTPILISILSVILCFSPYIYYGITELIALNSPHIATAGTTTSYECPSSKERSNNPYLTGLEDPLTPMNSLNAWDATCAYLETYYRTGKLPQTQTDLMPYIQSYEIKNGTVSISINGKQPKNTTSYNIITERGCNYRAGKNLSAISIWYRDPGKNNELFCEEVKTDEGSNLYDLSESHTWYSEQFDRKTRIRH